MSEAEKRKKSVAPRERKAPNEGTGETGEGVLAGRGKNWKKQGVITKGPKKRRRAACNPMGDVCLLTKNGKHKKDTYKTKQNRNQK